MSRCFLILILIFTLPTMADSMVGKVAYDLIARNVINHDGKSTVISHRGDVVIIEFWKTT